MKIVTWNCNGALRNKLAEADALQADVLVIQECEDPARSTESYRTWAGGCLWIGDNKNKGIGVFPKNNHRVQALAWQGDHQITGLANQSAASRWRSDELKYFLPFCLNDQFTVLAVWNQGRDAQAFAYIGQLWKYLQIHRADLARENVVVLGDFNSNSIWDQPDRWWNHSDVVQELPALNLRSAYHHHRAELPGTESQPTFYLQRNPTKPYHIDYVFTASALLPNSRLEIGMRGDWLGVSDHMPVSLTLGKIPSH
jgi:exodeoxyribonuclease-3